MKDKYFKIRCTDEVHYFVKIQATKEKISIQKYLEKIIEQAKSSVEEGK